MVVGFNKIAVTILLWCCLSGNVFAASNSIDGIRVWPAPENTRIVFDLKKKAEYSYFTLAAPNRLVIDFKNLNNTVALKTLAAKDPRIKRFRTSKSKSKGGVRLVLELAESYQLTVFPLAPAGQYGNRLVIDLYDQIEKKQRVETNVTEKRDIIVAVVAGHGGDDPGSIGANGSYEKKITLAIAKKLARLIDKQKGYKAVLIRKGDYYVNHNRKTEIARENRADLLISIHADAFTSKSPHGASVLVQSPRRANSEFTRWIANREAESELLGGAGDTIKKTKDKNLAIALADMKKEYTMGSSYDFAKHVLKQIKKVTKLHKSKPEGLSLAVLKSSDIPSVLIETGFISNPKEERLLNTSQYQHKIAKAIHLAVNHYFASSPPKGTLISTMGYRKHRVTSGESLSILAKRYNTSIAKLKTANNLKSNTVRIGQMLKIPRAG